jgi:carboxyl-terminal processing protease
MTAERNPALEFSRMDLAYDLHRQLTEYYPHWDTAPIRPDELWIRYRAQLEEADATCGEPTEPCPQYLGVLREMFAELRNGHTEVLVQNDLGRPAVQVGDVEGRAVVLRVERGSDASAAGIEAGMEIVAVDGRSVEKALARVPAWRVSFASPRMRTHAAFQALLEGPVDEEVRVAFRDAPLSPARVVSLHREHIRYEWEFEGQPGPPQPEVRSATSSRGGGIVYVHVDGFEGADAEESFDAVVDASLDAPGLILDLRENYGGVLDQAFRMVGRLLPEPVEIGEHCVAPREGSSRTACTRHLIEPRGSVFTGPLAVLIDENVYSAGELAAFALCRSGRARCFGATTAGETDCVFRLDLPGAVARMSWAGFRPAFGPSLQGTGVEPDIAIAPTIGDVRNGSDPVLDAARGWIEMEASREGGAGRRVDVAQRAGRQHAAPERSR